MQKILIVFLFIFLTGCFNEDYELKIIHTNDLHSHLLPFNDYGDCDINSNECKGGFARIVTFLNNEKDGSENSLIIDAGDRFTGTSFYTLTKSRYLIKTMSRMPYDVIGLGNHEFDDNIEETEKFLQALGVPVVVANTEFIGNSNLSNIIKPSVIIEKNNRKIGVIGLITEDLSPLGIKDTVKFFPIYEKIHSEIKELQKNGANIIVVISHLGLHEDIKLAQQVEDIDVIVGGHSHSLLSNDENISIKDGKYPLVINDKTLIVTAGMGGQYVGVLNVKFNKEGKITNFSGDTKAIDSHIANDEITSRIILEALHNLEQILNKPLAESENDYNFSPNKEYCAERCAIGDLITDLLKQAFPLIDIVFINSGAIRQAISKGQVSFTNLAQVYPYDTKAVLIELSGVEIKEYIQHGIKNYSLKERTNELLQVAGLEYEFSTTNKVVTNITINGKPLEENKIYRVLTSLYIAQGGDKYPVKQYQEVGTSIREAIQQQLLKTSKLINEVKNNVTTIK